MNSLQLNLQLLSNRFYEYVWRSPVLFRNRVGRRLGKSFSWVAKPMPPATNGVAWIRQTPDFNSRIYVFNYWTDHYGLSDVPIRLDVFDHDAVNRGTVNFTLAPRETRVIEAKDVLSQVGLEMPFQGTFVLRREVGGAGFGAPLKLLHEFYGKNFLSTVHEYGTVDNFAYKEFQVGVSIRADDNVDDILLGLVNCHYADSPTKQDLVLRVFNGHGEFRDVPAGTLGSGHSAFLSLNALLPGWRDFVGKTPGNIGLKFPSPIGRPLVFHKLRNGAMSSLNHLTGDKSRAPDIIRPRTIPALGLGPVWVAGVIADADLSSEISLIMNWGFGTPFDVEGSVFNTDGSVAGTFRRRMNPWETWVFNIEDVVTAPLSKPWSGSVRLNAAPGGIAPVSFDANVEFVGKTWRQPVNVGSSLLNLKQKEGVRTYQVNRTKNFMRIREDAELETYVLMVNHSSDTGYSVSSDTVLRLISRDGQRVATQRVSIPPRGTFFRRVRELFPDASAVMGADSVAVLHVRDTAAKLIGIHVVRNRSTAVLSADHYFGG